MADPIIELREVQKSYKLGATVVNAIRGLSLALHRGEFTALVGASGCSYEEAAKMCGCPIGTVKSRVSRARSRLAEILDGAVVPRDAMRPSAAMADIFLQCGRAGGVALAA